MKSFERWVPRILIVSSISVSVLFAYIATQRTLTNLEGVLLQSFGLLAGFIGSYVFGRQSALEAAKDIIKPHARSAFRRLYSLFQSLSRVANTIASTKDDPTTGNYELALAKLEAIVTEQLATADDALEDWRDIVPDEVEELKARLTKRDMPGEPK